ncbi:MAG: hypothetical protein GF399_06625 [Candidatus Coatesbacteria bacterium]|nr:hypothetical protein [Candidatus Coatesbacteria bacterium]
MSERGLSRVPAAVGRWTAMILVGLLAFAATAAVIVTLVLRIAYTNEELEAELAALINESLLGEVELGEVYLSPLSGVVVRGLTVYSSPEFDRVPALELDEFVLAYDLGDLLDERVLVIDTLEIGGLHVNLVERPGLGWNLEHLAPPSEEEEEEPFTLADLPVCVQLNGVGIRELSVAVSDGIAAELGGLSLELGELNTHAGGPLELRLHKEPGPVSLRLGPAAEPQLAAELDSLAFNLDLTAAAENSEPRLEGDLYLSAAGLEVGAPMELAPAGALVLDTSLEIDFADGRIDLDVRRLSLGDYFGLGLRTVVAVGADPGVRLALRELHLEVAPLLEDFGALLPPLAADGAVDAELVTRLDPDGFGGYAIDLEGGVVVSELSAVLPTADGAARIDGLDGSLDFSGSTTLAELQPELTVDGDFRLLAASQGPYSVSGLRLTLAGGVAASGPRLSGLAVGLETETIAGELDGAPVALGGLQLGAVVDADVAAGNFNVRTLTLRLGDALSWDGYAEVSGYGRNGVRVGFAPLTTRPEDLLALVPPTVLDPGDLYPYGGVRLEGEVQLAPGALELAAEPLAMLELVRTDLELELSRSGLATPYGGADGVDARLGLDLVGGSGDLTLTAGVDEVIAPVGQDLRDIDLDLAARLDGLQTLELERLTVDVASLDTSLAVNGGVSDLLGAPQLALRLQARAGRIGEELKINTGAMRIRGQVGLELEAAGPLTGSRPLRVKGRVRFHQLEVSQGAALSVNGLEGELPIDQAVNIQQPLPLPGKRLGEVSPYVERRYDLLAPFTPQPNLTIESVKFGDQHLDDLALRWELSGGALHIWRLALTTLGGEIRGDVHLRLDTAEPTYKTRLVFGGVNVGKLIEGLVADESSAINGDLTLAGEGFDFLGDFNVEGSVNLTKIGSEVVDRMLQFLDPEGSNPSITSVRGLLNRVGRQPKLVKMDLRNQKLTLELQIESTGFSLLSLFASFVDISQIIIPRIPVGGILERIAADLERRGVDTGS